MDELKRLLLEEAYTKESMIQATLAAENATIIGEGPEKAGSRHLEPQNKQR